MNYNEFCKLFTEQAPEAVAMGERYYLVGEDLAAFKSGEQRKPYAKGLFLGMGRKFVPSLALLRILAETSTRKTFILTEKAEWLFVCGRDVLSGNFDSRHEKGLVLVQNNLDENLGLGRITQEKGQTILKNILDRGNYLRHKKVRLWV